MLYYMCKQTNLPPSDRQLEHAIKRNFGGLETLNPYEEFLEQIPKNRGLANISEQVQLCSHDVII